MSKENFLDIEVGLHICKGIPRSFRVGSHTKPSFAMFNRAVGAMPRKRQPWPGKKRTESQLSEPSPAASPLRPQFLRVASQTVTETTTEFKQAETNWEAEEDILPDDSAQPHESASDTPSPTRKPAPHTFRLQSCGKSSRTSKPASELCWRNKASWKALIATQPGLIKRQLEVIE